MAAQTVKSVAKCTFINKMYLVCNGDSETNLTVDDSFLNLQKLKINGIYSKFEP